MSMNDFNDAIITEFRANDGKVGGNFEGAPLLLLHTTGAKSGQERIAPVMYLQDGDRVLVFASKAGAPDNPDWFHNLKANPKVSVEVGAEQYDAEAEILEGDDRTRLYARQAELYPGFAEYQEKTDRVIPVVALNRA
jgi:deazaflavin-dependent oxidoreductase (nitroreductase family)